MDNTYAESQTLDPKALLAPISDKVGANQKVSRLIEELEHPNTDWNYVIGGVRNYLFDYLYELAPSASSVMPVIFHYLMKGTERGKLSAIRASETFFDRYLFVLRKIVGGDTSLGPVKDEFDRAAPSYLDLMGEMGREGYFFSSVISRMTALADFFVQWELNGHGVAERLVEVLSAQYGLYVERSIKSNGEEIASIDSLLKDLAVREELVLLLEQVSRDSYAARLESVAVARLSGVDEALRSIVRLVEISHNSHIWEQICIIVRRSIDEGAIPDENSLISLLGYLIQKSNEGSDRDLQLFISRTIASSCAVFARSANWPVLKRILELVMPVLLAEIEREGNYYSAFSTIYNIGRTVIESGARAMSDYFTDMLVRAPFRFPRITGVAADWSVIVNSSHLENIRTWMRLIELDPPRMKKLAASLIVNLKLGGVFLKDTDVFQRDISQLLNSNYRDVFYLVTSLAAVFPAFYHDIGATGDIRAFTERIDTNHRMDDLIHFVRKQVHVESSSQTVALLQRVMEFWMTGDRSLLAGMVPPEVYDRLDRFYRLVNLAGDEYARRMVEEAKKVQGVPADTRFWDFLNDADANAFMEYFSSRDVRGVRERDRLEMLEFFREWFDSRVPTEMTRMLQFIRKRANLDRSGMSIWRFVYELSDDEFRKMFEDAERSEISRVNIEKFITFLHVYRMLFDKYNFSEVRALDKLAAYAAEDLFVPTGGLFDLLNGADPLEALDALLVLQQALKDDVLLSVKTYEPLDTIEFKRHIAFGIPSMYGSYKEKKFDTLKVFFILNLIRVRLFERLLDRTDFSGREDLDYPKVKRILQLFYRTFVIDGLANHEMTTVIDLLNTPSLTLAQFRDIVTHLLSIHGEISDRFNETFKYVCRESIRNIGLERISEKYRMPGRSPSIEVAVDRFMRDQIMQSPLLQVFDELLIKLRDVISARIAAKGDAICIAGVRARLHNGSISFEIKKNPSPRPGSAPFSPVWLTGNKAQGLLFAADLGGVNVPPGFILSTEVYKRIGEENILNPRFKRKLLFWIKRGIDTFTGGRFANPSNPLLLSVRSGAVFSLPGVMDTLTNVGITQEIIDRQATIDPWFAYDNYRRLIQDFGISAYGMDRSVFEKLMADAKEEAGVDLKEKLTGRQMENLTRKYRYAINSKGHSIPKDPYEQLLEAIIAVYRSWNSNVAKNYRDFINVSNEWGTAVIVQHMVYGNISPNNITGVVYSLNLDNEELGLFGEYKTRAQGHDIVSGVAKVFPISEHHKKAYAKSRIYPSLEVSYPGVYRMVYDTVRRIRDSWRNDVEIEFTVENNVLYILQIRGMAKHIFAVEEIAEKPEALVKDLLGQGLAASGGAVSGRAVFNIARIEQVKKKYKGDRILLVRPETNPEDVVGLKNSDGILTCVGGMTSHAVLQMRRLEKSGVSDFSGMKVDEVNNRGIVEAPVSGNGPVIVKEGDFLTIDGTTGNVYIGYHKTRKRD